MIRTPKPICRHPLENTVTVTLRMLAVYSDKTFHFFSSLVERKIRGYEKQVDDNEVTGPAITRIRICKKTCADSKRKSVGM